MEFIKIKVSWKDYPENLYRIILVKKDITLEELSYSLCLLLKTRFEHLSLFRCGEDIYIDEDSAEEYEWISFNNVKITDMLDKYKQISFEYDSGEGYSFLVKRCSKYFYEYPFKTDAILVEAKGDGIFEDNISGLYSIMENEEFNENSYKNILWDRIYRYGSQTLEYSEYSLMRKFKNNNFSKNWSWTPNNTKI